MNTPDMFETSKETAGTRPELFTVGNIDLEQQNVADNRHNRLAGALADAAHYAQFVDRSAVSLERVSAPKHHETAYAFTQHIIAMRRMHQSD